MDSDVKPNIVSFVVRFVQEHPEKLSGQCAYRGAIRHVQMDKEVHFTRWEEAVNFIQEFVPIDRISGQEG